MPILRKRKRNRQRRENTIEHDFLQALEKEDHSWDDEKRVFKCENCGAETLLDKDKVADFCSFCGSSHIAISEHHAGIKPALVLPFQISKDEAVEKFKVWIKKRYLGRHRDRHRWPVRRRRPHHSNRRSTRFADRPDRLDHCVGAQGAAGLRRGGRNGRTPSIRRSPASSSRSNFSYSSFADVRSCRS